MNESLKKRVKWILIGWALLRLIYPFGAGDLCADQTDRIEKDLYQKKNELEKIKKAIYQSKIKEKEIQRKESSVLKQLRQLTVNLQQKEKELKK